MNKRLRQVVEFLAVNNRKSPRSRAPRMVEELLTDRLTEDDANQLVELASELLRVACGKHGYCYGELHDMLPHGDNPETTDPANGTTHGKGNSEFPFRPEQWEGYYTDD